VFVWVAASGDLRYLLAGCRYLALSFAQAEQVFNQIQPYDISPSNPFQGQVIE
jgi:hypothetical protein